MADADAPHIDPHPLSVLTESDVAHIRYRAERLRDGLMLHYGLTDESGWILRVMLTLCASVKKRGVAAEQERCAKIAETFKSEDDSSEDGVRTAIAFLIQEPPT